MRRLKSVVGLLLMLATTGYAQEISLPVKFDAQMRIRSEVDGRDFDGDTDLNTFTLLRARLGVRAQPLEDVAIYLQMQDSRAFGTEPNTLAHTANLDLHQGYIEIQNLWHKAIDLRIGRQEFIYANERILGAVGFSNVGRSFDGVKLSFGRRSRLDLLSAVLSESNTPVAGPATPQTVAGRDDQDARFFGAYYQHRQKPDYTLDVYGLFELDNRQLITDGDRLLRRFTLGSYNRGKFSDKFDFESELALQLGKRLGQDVFAFMITGSVGYTFATGRRPSIRLGYDYLSGMDADDEDYKVFDTLFATNHKFYGFMDFFTSIPAQTDGQGLQDFMLKFGLPLGKGMNFKADFHNFRAARGAEKDFGNELDLVWNYKYNQATAFQFVLSFFAPGDLMEARFGSGDLAVWSYASLLVNL